MPVEELLQKASYLTKEEKELLVKAYNLAQTRHQDQKRLSGEPYIIHPLAVAKLLTELKVDCDTLCAALLHDTLEDTSLTREELELSFGHNITQLVDGATKLKHLHPQAESQNQAENLQKMLLAMAKDIRVVLVKLADRLHNLQTIRYHTPERQKVIAQETLDIYAPLAGRLSIGRFKWELEDLAFQILKPKDFAEISKAMNMKRKDREKQVAEAIKDLKNLFAKENFSASITGRPKHFYSIYKKMQAGRSLNDIYDLLALRVIAPNIKDCYAALGLIHSLWKPIPGRFKDYIAIPKSNGYQSLHTTVVGKMALILEIQIRTPSMDEAAIFGKASHWGYKEGITSIKSQDRLVWLELLRDFQAELKDALPFVNTVKEDLFKNEVFVFTPRGDIHSLPVGSTPLDFAYRIHTAVGHHFGGAKVNNQIVPATYTLRNGDICEILANRQKNAGPSLDWLKIVKTSSAREKIRTYLRTSQKKENVLKGKDLLEKELLRLHAPSLSSLSETELSTLLKAQQRKNIDDLLAAIGYGDIHPRSIAFGLLKDTMAETIPISLPTIKSDNPGEQILIEGLNNVMTTLASCCQPIAGDKIAGYITRGKGITIHRLNCPNLQKTSDPHRIVKVSWDHTLSILYAINLTILAMDRPGLLKDISSVIGEANIKLTALEANTNDQDKALIKITVEIESLTQLSELLEKMEALPSIASVQRNA